MISIALEYARLGDIGWLDIYRVHVFFFFTPM